jgi:hypothetical protein
MKPSENEDVFNVARAICDAMMIAGLMSIALAAVIVAFIVIWAP